MESPTMLKRLTACTERSRSVARVAVVVAAAIVVACGGERSLLVSPRLDGAPPLGVVSDPSGARIHPVRRQTPLLKDESWSFDVGPSGTVAQDLSTGLTITVPARAIAAPTHITVTALKGAPLAYRFEPHGLQFAVPVQLTQALYGLQLTRPIFVPQLFAGYFADDSLATDAVTGDARVIEILPVYVDIEAHTAILQIRHFSGYTVASATKDSLSDER
jgi:hypothetical protein